MKPQVAILTTEGTNCDRETSHAFSLAGAIPQPVHLNRLIQNPKLLSNFQILALPGGFSFGDDILSAKVLAIKLHAYLEEMINKFITQQKLLIGICNGFQALVRLGVLPWDMRPAEDVSLVYNVSGKFECRWIRLKIGDSPSVFTQGLAGTIIEMPVAHGEGKFITKNQTVLKKIKQKNLISFQYADANRHATMTYPDNPNGTPHAIAGVTDPTGRILGLMPHPERHVTPLQHPQHHRKNGHPHPTALPLFQNAVDYFM